MTTPSSVLPRTARLLDSGWSLRCLRGPAPTDVAAAVVPATVPGSVHTDLMAAGLIPDVYLDNNEALTQWIGLCDWEYRTTFNWHADGQEHHELVFDGLDTVATVSFNGAEVLTARNMHRTFRVHVRPREGENTLVVMFESPIRYADQQSLALGYRPTQRHHPFNAIRKMACSFGWDWGIDTATSGIWKPVRLESWSAARLAAVRPIATVDGTSGKIAVHIDLEKDSTGPDHQVVVHSGGRQSRSSVAAGAASVEVDLVIPDAARWWPRGYGDQPLYDVLVELQSPDGDTVDRWSGRVGFREVAVQLDADEVGTSFQFVVNDQPVFIRGANWIPDDAFPHRVSRERYAARLDQAETANINLLRVWGGGIFESDDFFDLCDERGILTWQDFLFACAAYSEAESMRSEIEAEVRDNVTRLCPHPSLALWNGNNENIWGFHDWDWEPRLDGRDWGLGYYTELLPRLVAELDPGRPYTEASPWSGSLDIHPNHPDHGSVHLWEQWNSKDFLTYRDVVPRFCAEFGWQGPPTWSTTTRAISDQPLTPQSPGMQVHQKAALGNDKLTDGLVPHFRMPDVMEDWHWAMSLNQAHAVQVAIEHMRSWSPRCAGAVVWQLNDCWPAISWAAVDGDGRAKPLLHAIKHAYADRLVTIQPRGDDGDAHLAVVLVNDTASEWDDEIEVARYTFDGDVASVASIPVRVGARGTATVRIPSEVAETRAPDAELLVATAGGVRGTWYFAEPRASRLAPARLRVAVEPTANGALVRVTADNLVRDLTLLVDKVEPGATVSDMLVTLLPGESVELTITAPASHESAAFVRADVVRTTNDLVAGPGPIELATGPTTA